MNVWLHNEKIIPQFYCSGLSCFVQDYCGWTQFLQFVSKCHCVVPENIHTPPPPHTHTEDHWKFWGRGGGVKGSYFRGVGRVHWKLLFQRVTINHEQNTESNVQSIISTKTYVCCFETKVSTPAIEMRLTSLALMFLFFFELASTTISRRTMCLWNEVETI